jgi:hypothetical protein
MGDRFSFGVVDEGGDVLYLYSHWGGDTWHNDLKGAIWKAGIRSKAPDYANRILMSQLIGESWDRDGGFGFSINNPTDTEYGYIPIVDFHKSTVTFYEFKDELGDAILKLSILDYISTDDEIHAMLRYAQGILEEARPDVTV